MMSDSLLNLLILLEVCILFLEYSKFRKFKIIFLNTLCINTQFLKILEQKNLDILTNKVTKVFFKNIRAHVHYKFLNFQNVTTKKCFHLLKSFTLLNPNVNIYANSSNRLWWFIIEWTWVEIALHILWKLERC